MKPIINSPKYYSYDILFILFTLGFSVPLYFCNIKLALELTLLSLLFLVLLPYVFHKQNEYCEKARMAFTFAFIFYIYQTITRIIISFDSPIKDHTLLKIDKLILGETPAIWLEGYISNFFTDFFYIMYISYDFYLATALLWALKQSTPKAQKLAHYLFVSFFWGFLCYLVIPAVGPYRAFPEIFTTELGGTAISTSIFNFIYHAAPGYDVFPSLHILILLILLDYDWQEHRIRFWFMLLLAPSIILSTMYLRYHYAIDILAAIILFIFLRTWYHNKIDVS